ncbi:LOW QUALITY PROTEIN: hypothetical protein PHMEG_00036082 [Phytophthora megakarya]|uniref:Uncharacterized protein n=1 Tax=Phytophthora megakarya TaxID=4795 RepID=A0A225UMN6_9STRA|nr:LOW QUALITY PROTEIN: hypothetical protein PHMEG_00036082 [Phytophthora megakarya]
MSHIRPRWSLSCDLYLPAEEEGDEAVCGLFRIRDSTLGSMRHKVLNGTNKFRTFCRTRIAKIMGRNGTPVFNQMLDNLKRFETIITDGEVPVVSDDANQVSKPDLLSQYSNDIAVPTVGFFF